MPSNTKLEPGVYHVADESGTPIAVEPGTFTIDEDGNLTPAVSWQRAVDRIPWEKLDQFLDSWNKRGNRQRMTNMVIAYVLVAFVLAMSAVLAYVGIIEGQALVGFFGTAIGYVLAKGRIPFGQGA